MNQNQTKREIVPYFFILNCFNIKHNQTKKYSLVFYIKQSISINIIKVANYFKPILYKNRSSKKHVPLEIPKS